MLRFGHNIKNAFTFYPSIEYQSRYIDECDGVTNSNEYIYCDIHALPPFQVRRIPSGTPPVHNLTIVCVGTGEIKDLNYGCVDDEFIVDSNVLVDGEYFDYITYQPTVDCDLSMDEGIYYAVYSDGTNTWYSEFVVIKNFSGDVDNLRIWTKYSGTYGKRKTDSTKPTEDLREYTED